SPSSGLANKLIAGVGGQPINFLTDPLWFRQVLVALDVWKNIGWNAIIYLAALAGISPSLYEAAAVDGASRLQRVWHISVPAIVPVIALVTMLNIGNLLSARFEQVFVFYNPSVYGVGDIIDTWVYRQGIEGFQYSVAAAVGLFKGVVGCALFVTAHLLAQRWAGVGVWGAFHAFPEGAEMTRSLSWEDKLWDCLVWGALAAVTLVMLIPLWYVLVTSLTAADVWIRTGGSLWIWPTNISLSAYRLLLSGAQLPRAFGVSVYITLVGTL